MNNKRANRVFIFMMLFFFGGAALFGASIHFNKEADLDGEQTAYTECTVLEKWDKPIARGQVHKRNYFIDSSCGMFRTASKEISDSFEIGYDYNWSATEGNWANKPTILSTEVN